MSHLALPVGMQPGEPLPYGIKLISADKISNQMTYTVNFSVMKLNSSSFSIHVLIT